jgi:hypothetical protein
MEVKHVVFILMLGIIGYAGYTHVYQIAYEEGVKDMAILMDNELVATEANVEEQLKESYVAGVSAATNEFSQFIQKKCEETAPFKVDEKGRTFICTDLEKLKQSSPPPNAKQKSHRLPNDPATLFKVSL